MKFSDAIEFIFEHEGGYSNDPKDPGGETKFGISKRAYPMLDIKNLTEDEAREIYRRDYWDACNIESLPEQLRLAVFDCAINQGPARAVTFLQTALNLKPDGKLGPVTSQAAHQANPEKTLEKFLHLRLSAYFMTRNFLIYGLGWVKRLVAVAIRSRG